MRPLFRCHLKLGLTGRSVNFQMEIALNYHISTLNNIPCHSTTLFYGIPFLSFWVTKLVKLDFQLPKHFISLHQTVVDVEFYPNSNFISSPTNQMRHQATIPTKPFHYLINYVWMNEWMNEWMNTNIYLY